MNHPFIKEMAGAYYNDFQLRSSNIWENKQAAINEISSEMIGLMENLKLDDIDIYVSLHEDFDPGHQQQILYSLIHQYLNESHGLYDDVYEDVDLTAYDTPEAFLYEYYTGEFIQEFAVGPALLGAFGGALAIIAGYKKISRAGWKILATLNDVNKKIAKTIDGLTKSGKIKQAILVHNSEACYKKCGVKPNEVSRWAGMALSSNVMVTPESRKQAVCLTECYLQWTIQNVTFLAKAYADCLRGTGERGNEINDIIAILSHPPSSHVCKSYFDLLKQHYDNFKDTIEVIFKDDPNLANQWNMHYKKVLEQNLKVGAPKFNQKPPRVGKEYSTPGGQNNQRQNNQGGYSRNQFGGFRR